MCLGHMAFYFMIYGLHKAKNRWCLPSEPAENTPTDPTGSRGDFASVPLEEDTETKNLLSS